MLGMQKLDEAREYFSIARNISNNDSLFRSYIRSLMYEALTDFLYGSMSASRENVEKTISMADIHQEREVELFLIFLSGRINFNLGDYESALSDFQRCLTVCDLYSFTDRKKVFLAWMGRAFAYCGEVEKSLDILKDLKQDSEVLYFLSETAYLAGYNRKA